MQERLLRAIIEAMVNHAFRLRHELFRFRATVVVKKDGENWKEMYHFQEENLFLLYVFLKCPHDYRSFCTNLAFNFYQQDP